MTNIVKAYNAGIVFTEDDMKKIIHTNLKVMWNGDENNPQYANSNADLLGTIGKPEATIPRARPRSPAKRGPRWPNSTRTIRKLSGRAAAAAVLTTAPPPASTAATSKPGRNPRRLHASSPWATSAPCSCRRHAQHLPLRPALRPHLQTPRNRRTRSRPLLRRRQNQNRHPEKRQLPGGSDGRAGVNYFLWTAPTPPPPKPSPPAITASAGPSPTTATASSPSRSNRRSRRKSSSR